MKLCLEYLNECIFSCASVRGAKEQPVDLAHTGSTLYRVQLTCNLRIAAERTASVRVKVGGKKHRYGYTQLSGKVWEERKNSVGS